MTFTRIDFAWARTFVRCLMGSSSATLNGVAPRITLVITSSCITERITEAIQSGREAAWGLFGATVALVIVTPLLAIATFRLVRTARSEPRAPSEEVSDDAEALP